MAAEIGEVFEAAASADDEGRRCRFPMVAGPTRE